MDKMTNFKEAFDQGIGSCRQTCECGHIFYNSGDGDWDWEVGELKDLDKDPNAICLDYPVPLISFESHEYVPECDCWKKRAEMIIGFLDTHNHQIAKYLTLEKERKQIEADYSPVVK